MKFVFKWRGEVPPKIERLFEELSNPQAAGMWDRVSNWLRNIVDMMFRNKGGQYGRDVWPDISPSIYDRIRMGTDGRPHGRYGDRPGQPLRASGAYRRSFDAISKPRPTMLVWGSKHPLAAVIPFAGGKERFALPDAEDKRFNSDLTDVSIVQFVRDAVRRANS